MTKGDDMHSGDQVALAVDQRGWASPTARGNPFENATFVKNAIASGSIIPPKDEGASVRQMDIKVGIAVLFLLGFGVVALLFAVLR